MNKFSEFYELYNKIIPSPPGYWELKKAVEFLKINKFVEANEHIKLSTQKWDEYKFENNQFRKQIQEEYGNKINENQWFYLKKYKFYYHPIKSFHKWQIKINDKENIDISGPNELRDLLK